MSCSFDKKSMPIGAFNYFDPQITLANVTILILILLVFSPGSNNRAKTRRMKRIKRRKGEDTSQTYDDKVSEIPSDILPYLYLIIIFHLLGNNEEIERKETKYNSGTIYEKNISYNEIGHKVATLDTSLIEPDLTLLSLPLINGLKNASESIESDSEQYIYPSDKLNNICPSNTDDDADYSDEVGLVHDNELYSLESDTLLSVNCFKDNVPPYNPLPNLLKNDYRGVMVSALLPNGTIISGEVAFNFANVVALKYEGTTIFISEDRILSFY